MNDDDGSAMRLDPRWSLTERPARVDDADDVHALAVLAGQAMDQPPLATHTEILADLMHPNITLDLDTRVIHDADGELQAYGVFYVDRPGRSFLDLYLRPAIHRELLDHLLDYLLATGVHRAADDAHDRGLTRTIAETGAQRVDTPMFDAFARNGFHHGRTWWRMQIDFGSVAPPAEPELPTGITIEIVDPLDDGVAQRLYTLDETAFAHHYGHVPTDLATWTVELRNEAGFDPSLARIARVDGVDAALLIGSDRIANDDLGYIDSLGVLEEFRGRGLGRALLQHAFAEYAQRGRTGVRLNVDSDNATGATRLYESVGMSSVEVVDTWELEVWLDGA